MKMVLIVTDVLSNNLLGKNQCPALNGMEIRDIKATVPYLPETAEATFWTGLPVSQHGITGLNGKVDIDVPMLWDVLTEEGVKISIDGSVSDDVEGLVDPKEADLLIIHLDGFAKTCKNNGMSSRYMTRHFNKLNQAIMDNMGSPMLVVGICGFASYVSRFNLAPFLQSRGYCTFKGNGIDMEKSSVYPAVLDDDNEFQFGVNLNRKPDGWLEQVAADRIQGALTGWMNRIPNIQPVSKVRMYPAGKFYDELPDLVFYANTDVVFPTLGRDRPVPFEGFKQDNYSVNTLLFSNFDVSEYQTEVRSTRDVSSLVFEHFSRR